MHFRPPRAVVLRHSYTRPEPCRNSTYLFSRQFTSGQDIRERHVRRSRSTTADASAAPLLAPNHATSSYNASVPSSVRLLHNAQFQGNNKSAESRLDSSPPDTTASKNNEVITLASKDSEAHQDVRSPARPDGSSFKPHWSESNSESSPDVSSTQTGELAEKKRQTPEEKYEELTLDAHKEVYLGTIPAQVIPPMLRTIRSVRQLGLPDETPGYVAETLTTRQPAKRLVSTIQLEKTSMRLIRDFGIKRKDPLWRDRLRSRLQLPVMSDNRHAQIIEELGKADVLIIPGSTGSGKSTQVPQIVLDYAIQKGRGGFTNIICTQPRRISATSVARRVAYERNENLGETVGHHVRYSPELPRRNGSILYCTTGILWKYLQHDPDWILDTSSHIMLDEVHERSAHTDILLLTLRNLISQRRDAKRPYPKLVLMSATINAEAFIEYFSNPPAGINSLRTSVVQIPGRLHPITSHHLEDFLQALQAGAQKPAWLRASQEYLKTEMELSLQQSADPNPPPDVSKESESRFSALKESTDEMDIELEDSSAPAEQEWNFESIVPAALVALTVVHVLRTTSTGDVLVFLPGMADIEQVAKYLDEEVSIWTQRRHSGRGVKVFKLHSTMNDTNDEVFDEMPDGWRRVILSTNIAQTSITLPEVQHVIDTGTSKAFRLDRDNGSRGLATVWIDQQSQQQRRGRAGRLSAGNYYALYTRARSDTFAPEQPPELLTDDLTRFALEIKASVHSMDLTTAFALAPNPPGAKEVLDAKETLKRLGAITSAEELTPLGRVLSTMSCEPTAGKAAVLGILFRCFEPMLVAAAMGDESMLIAKQEDPGGAAKSRWDFSRDTESGILANINAFKDYNQAIKCRDFERATYLTEAMGVRPGNCLDISRSARQICQDLKHVGLLPTMELEDSNIFPSIPPELNVNSDYVPLIKALLALTTQSELAVRFSRQTWLSRQGLMFPGRHFINETLKNHHLKQGLGGRIPSRGDMMSYMYGRKIDTSGHKVMMESSMITPLIAILMADAVSISADTGMINIDEIINMKIDFSNDSTRTTLAQKMHLANEFRKMIERFQQSAFATLSYRRVGGESSTPDQGRPFHEMFTGNNELRDALTQGLIKVLNVDGTAELDILENRRELWLKEQADRDKERQRLRAKAQAQKDKQKAQSLPPADRPKETYSENAAASELGDSVPPGEQRPVKHPSSDSTLRRDYGQASTQGTSGDLLVESTPHQCEASAATG